VSGPWKLGDRVIFNRDGRKRREFKSTAAKIVGTDITGRVLVECEETGERDWIGPIGLELLPALSAQQPGDVK